MNTHRLLVSMTVTAALISGCSKPQASEPTPAVPVKTETVAAAPPQPGIRYSASIEAFEQVPLAFKASGYVEMLLQQKGVDGRLRAAQPGDRVMKGTVLARVQEADYRQRVSQGQARLAEGTASLVRSRLDLERAKTLFAAESLTKPDLDAAQAAFDAAEARVSAVRVDIELALSALRECALVTPDAGIILERRIEVGTLAGAGTIGFVLGDVSSVKAHFGVPDSAISSLKLGDAIQVIVDAADGTTFGGRLTAIAPAADPQSRVFDVEVTIPNMKGLLRPGMIGTVVLNPAADGNKTTTGPATVPLTAIVRSHVSAGQFAVLVVERERDLDVARLRRVDLGQVMGNVIAVHKGVNVGDRVVVSGASLLADGDAVRVMQ